MFWHYPVLLVLRHRLCIVVGGGAVAARKIGPLLECEARVRAVAPDFSPSVAALGAANRVELVARPYQPGDLAGATLAIAATDDPDINHAVWQEAEERGVLVNVVDDPEHCTFTVPATVRRGPLLLTASTGGASPSLAREIRERLEREYGPEWGTFAAWLGEIRERVKSSFSEPDRRAQVWMALVQSDALELLRAGDEAGARACLESIVRRLTQEAV
jgi:precorrin-2 dehydrogenase/sirohydrochlorin ferrochelatase